MLYAGCVNFRNLLNLNFNKIMINNDEEEKEDTTKTVNDQDKKNNKWKENTEAKQQYD